MDNLPTVEKIELRHGNYYQMIQQSSNMALMMRSQKSNEYHNKIPVMDKPNDSELNQVWMIEHIKQRNSYQIVHALSTLVLENCVKNIKLSFGEWKSGQLFVVESAPSSISNAFVIREKAGSKNFFYADRDGVLQFGERDESAKQIIWLLRIAEKTNAITQSILFENAFTNMAMDVPEASSKEGVKIVQYPVNKRFNQRFKLIFSPESNTYQIENVKSLKVLDIKEGSRKEGTNIIQWTHNGGINQKWYIQNQGKDLYLLRSAMDPDLFIGIKNNEIKECAQLVTTKSQDFALWRILGEFTKLEYELV